MVGVLVDGIGREVKEFLLHPKEDELLPSQRKAAAAGAAADGSGSGQPQPQPPAAAEWSSGQPSVEVAGGASVGPVGLSGAANEPAAAIGADTLAAAAQQAQAAGQVGKQREHLPVLERVLREAPGESSKC